MSPITFYYTSNSMIEISTFFTTHKSYIESNSKFCIFSDKCILCLGFSPGLSFRSFFNFWPKDSGLVVGAVACQARELGLSQDKCFIS